MRVKFLIFLLFLNIAFANHCELLKQNPLEYLKTSKILNEHEFFCDGSALTLNELQRLFAVTKNIRDENEACVGNAVVSENLSKFGKRVLLASYAHESYLKLLKRPETAEAIKDEQKAFLRYWGYQCFDNFLKFKEFWTAYNEAQTPLVKFYEAKGLDTQSAAFYATSILNDFLDFAVGNQLIKDADISPEQKALSDRSSDEEALLSMLYSKKFSQNELDEILKTALLLNKDTQIIAQILRLSQGLESTNESMLFYALGSEQNVEFLLKNGADIRFKNTFGANVLFDAVKLKNAKLVKILINAGADINQKLIDQNTKSMMAGMGQSLSFYLKFCELEHTAMSLFMHAAATSTVEILEILVENGIDVNALDDLGFNALDYAKRAKNGENIKFLEQIGLKANIE
ncbi:ankyrin repeat domain-containing protein [Campylobacter sp. M4]|uniref:ankyrin repeat domain-containing protein n=1 Tax=Campylobacter sp. M4 TaxID=3424761 RepID=UPI003D3256B0